MLVKKGSVVTLYLFDFTEEENATLSLGLEGHLVLFFHGLLDMEGYSPHTYISRPRELRNLHQIIRFVGQANGLLATVLAGISCSLIIKL